MKITFATVLAAAVAASLLSFSPASAAGTKHAQHQNAQTAPPHFDAAEFFATQYLRGGS